MGLRATAARIHDGCVSGLVVVAGVLIAISIAMVITDVVMRATGHKPPGFTVAFVEYILLYFTLLCAPYLVREKGHVCVDVLVRALSGVRRASIEKLVYLLCVVVSLVFAVMGWSIFAEAIRFGYVDERSVDIPYWTLYFLFPISFGLIAIEFARYLFGAGSYYEQRQPIDSV